MANSKSGGRRDILLCQKPVDKNDTVPKNLQDQKNPNLYSAQKKEYGFRTVKHTDIKETHNGSHKRKSKKTFRFHHLRETGNSKAKI